VASRFLKLKFPGVKKENKAKTRKEERKEGREKKERKNRRI
jgi:hypothetical protein